MKKSTTNPRTVAEFKRLHALLIREQAELQERLREIDSALFGQAAPAPKAEPAQAPAVQPKRKAKSRGSILAQIEPVLKAAGPDGVSVGQILERTPGLNKNSLNVWFYTTGKKHPNIRKVGPGRFAWSE